MNGEQKKSGNIFRDARDILKGRELAERMYRKEVFRLCDWNDPEDVLHYKRMRRLEDRNVLLDKLTKDRRCPGCARIILLPSGWIISKKKDQVLCRSCFYDLKHKRKPQVVQLFELKMFTAERYILDSSMMKRVRESAGVSLKEFSKKAGWGKSYQQKLEDGESLKTVSTEVMNVVIAVLNDLGVTTLDTLG